MTDLRAFWDRLCWCWFILCNPVEYDIARHPHEEFKPLRALLASKYAPAVRDAVLKVRQDRSFHPYKDNDLKRREAQEWSRTYARETYGVGRIPDWDLDFLIEYEVGLRKGRL